MSSDIYLPVMHLVCDQIGGRGRYVERLLSAQANASARRLSVFGPPNLKVPDRVSVDAYSPVERWGLNQWYFATRSLRPACRSETLVHAHSLSLARADVFTVHGIYHQNWLARPDRARLHRAQFEALSRLERHVLQCARHVVYQCHGARRYIECALRIPLEGRSTRIVPGVDPATFHAVGASRRLELRRALVPDASMNERWLLFVGNDFAAKGLLEILRSAVARGLPRARLLVCGHDPRNIDVARRLSRPLADHVHFLGDRGDVAAVMQAADILVMASAAEGFGMVVLEAMASGCVPVVSRFGGVEDVVRPDVDGVVVGDAAAVLDRATSVPASWLERAAHDAARSPSLRSWSGVAEDYEQVYGRLAAGRRRCE